MTEVQPGVYFGNPFYGYCGVTQGGTLSCTIFNVVLDAVLQHWVTMVESTKKAVEPGATETEGFGWDVQRLTTYFYADYGLLALTWVARLHWS